MKIALLGAMPEEIEPILEQMQQYKTVSIANNNYYLASFGNHELVIAYSKIGKVFSTLTATMLLEHFNAEVLLFSGVAGAISNDLKVGDLITATALVQHDLDITAFGHPYGFVPEGAVMVHTDNELIGIAKNVAQSMNIALKEGVIATGDQFIANSDKKTWIAETFSADALEMEGAAVAVVCDALNVPCFILRAISDAADMDASFDFDTFLKSSAKQSASFILKMVESL